MEMAAFTDFIDTSKLNELYEDGDMHRHFFGSVRVQRRGRLKWKIGITRSIMQQRRERGIKIFPVEAHVKSLSLLKRLYVIKRSRRLWSYFYDAMRFKATGLSMGAVKTATLSKKHFADYHDLKGYLGKQGVEHTHHHSFTLSHKDKEPSKRLSIAQVSDLETERQRNIEKVVRGLKRSVYGSQPSLNRVSSTRRQELALEAPARTATYKTRHYRSTDHFYANGAPVVG